MVTTIGIGMGALFFVILFALIVLNAHYNKDFKIEGTWIAVALAPAVIWLLATGQLTELAGFGLELKLKNAAEEPVATSSVSLPIEPLQFESRSKEGYATLERMLRDRTPGLSFELGRTGYYNGSAILRYLRDLNAHAFFRYVLFFDGAGNFRAIAPGDSTLAFVEDDPQRFVDMIEQASIDALPELITQTVPAGSDRRVALGVFQSIDAAELPVVDAQGKFAGTIARDRLVNDIVLELVKGI